MLEMELLFRIFTVYPHLGRQQSQLKQTIIDSLPHEVGFPAKFNRTLEIIASYIHREFGRDYSIRGVSKMMHQLTNKSKKSLSKPHFQC
ncbi:hypothetical protein C8Z91_25025 [Paenibacillus elgii]|uniref:Winged helix-turn helix domain-containing protein n=1 Tax=Paenibacillus elgii TaxID=189691 RepID=A0A2T6FXK5_9BACL|nr:winged helix-turn-helix domain-containing protein [Paenibacillus elgii]PUA36644.1 hypothetical protein C8Z91_25025 [Paenibacillus elgii]